jgi:hypothetical protein
MASNTPAEQAAVPETPLWKQPMVLKGALLTLRLLQVRMKPTTASHCATVSSKQLDRAALTSLLYTTPETLARCLNSQACRPCMPLT